MVTAVGFLILLPSLISYASEGNIHLLEDEIAIALRACSYPNRNTKVDKEKNQRQRRYIETSNRFFDEQSPSIDSNIKGVNQYEHVRRNATDMQQVRVLNTSENDYGGYDDKNDGKRITSSVTHPTIEKDSANYIRVKRTQPLLNKDDSDKCLNQCVFTNLEVIDSRGIPLEAELWSKIQSSVASQQSRTALRNQIRACFQDLEAEGNDNGCSFSNKLERCLMLNIAERKINATN